MRLYQVQFDGQSWWIEAHDFAAAVAVWREAVKVQWENQYSEDDEPESVALISTDPVLRAPRRRAWVIGRADAPRYRSMEQGNFTWVDHIHAALQFSRRADAELVAAEDEDASQIIEHTFEGE